MKTKEESILVVDDEEAIRRLLKESLSSEGYNCQEANGAEQAMAALRSNPAALVLLDIKMPAKPGTELLPEITASYPDTAVIMATVMTDTATAVECMKKGAYDYITKPFSLDELVLNVERALERRGLRLENRDYQQHLEQRVEEQARKIQASSLNVVTSLAYALEAKDRYTSGHSQRVAQISVAIARELGIPRDRIERIRLAGLIHDIGKIGVKESVLNKPGKLSGEEFQHIQRHCKIGEHILRPIIDDEGTLDVVRHHHERYDGAGYPSSLKGDNIPLEARIVSIADAYEAMTSPRPYRKGKLTHKQALEELERNAGRQFDPELVKVFCSLRGQISQAEVRAI